MMMTDKRNEILEATLKLISQYGFHGTPMSMIAEEAGVGTGTIYRYFDSKEALINELFLETKREISQAMLAGITPEASVEEVFRQVWLNTFDYCVRNPEEMLFLEQFHNSPFQTPESKAATLEYLAPIVSIIQTDIESGRIKALPFEMLTIYVYDVTVAHAKRHLSGVLEMDQANLELAVQACWDAIKAT
jgi:AcrR family transcriptional regulator